MSAGLSYNASHFGVVDSVDSADNSLFRVFPTAFGEGMRRAWGGVSAMDGR